MTPLTLKAKQANVETKDGTTKGSGLPCVAAVLVWNQVPEFKKPSCSVKREASEVASKAGGVETVTLSGTGCDGEAAK